MGLDQYANTGDGAEVAYWRKHNRLQGWMENLWRKNGGGGELFNGVDVELTLEDMDRLETAINDETMPETIGFFFGPDSYGNYGEEYKSTDLKFIEDGRRAINADKKLYYSSSW